jgi:hypothetical protein
VASGQARSGTGWQTVEEPGVYLPTGLQLIASDQKGDILLETQDRQADDYIQLRLRGEVDEAFTLQIRLEDTALIERFMI